MTFTQIRYFIEVARCLSFSEAAGRLYVSQQAVSSQIRNLEREVGVPLFLRTTKQVSLTESGRILYQEWEDMLKRTDKALQRALEAGMGQPKKIRIGIAEMSGIIDVISVALAKYSELWPDTEFESEILPFRKLEYLLQKKEVDIIITLSSELVKRSSIYGMRTISDLQLGIVLSSKHPLAQQDVLETKDLVNETFYVFSSLYSSEATEMILSHCRKEGFTPSKIKYFDNCDSMEVALHTGRGVTLAYNIFFRNKDKQLKFYPIQGVINQYLVAAWQKDSSKEIQRVIDYIVEH